MRPFSHFRVAIAVNILRIVLFVLVVTPLSAPALASGGTGDPQSFRVRVTGTGLPMILIPGLSSSGDTWNAAVARYETRFTCHVLTLAGFAGVPPIDQPLLASVRQELTEYIRTRRLNRPILVGHSLGGTLALALAAEHPDLVGPLVIVDALPFMAGASFHVKTLDEARPRIAAMHAYMSTLTSAQYEESVRSGAATTFMVARAADLELIKRWGLASNPRTAADAMAELFSLDLRDDLARITSPTLVLGTWIGLHDQLAKYAIDVPRDAVVRTFEEQFTKARPLHFVLSETARHFIMFDDPDWFFRQLDAFLADPVGTVQTRGF